MADAVIDLRDVTRTFRMGDVDVHALAGVSLRVGRGEFVAIMGASGSGKSTLMNVIGCLDRPSSGRYVLEGVDVAHLDEPALAQVRSLRIGFVFQSFQLLSRTSALENVMLPLLYAGQADGAPARARAALAALGLAGREQSHPSQLSGGQQQRVAIARALINDPAILLADEPTGNLDSRTATEIMELLQRLNRERGLTIVLVTHEQRMANYADRIVTVSDGAIVSDVRTREAAPPPPALAAPPPHAESSDLRFLASLGRMAFAVAAQSIARSPLRSALTTLGILIGVAALIAMVAIGQGANTAVMQQIERLGSNMVVVLPGANTSGGARGGFGSSPTLRVGDAEAIEADAPAVAAVSYVMRGAAQAQYGDKNWNTTVQGVSPRHLDIQVWPLVAGRRMTVEEEQSAARVCLIGQTVLANLFGAHENPLGATIQVKNVPLRVIGVLASLGQTGFGRDQDDVILVPFSTAETKILGVALPTVAAESTTSIYASQRNPFGVAPKLTGYVNMIFVKAKDAAQVETALAQVKQILGARHPTPPDEPPAFDVRNVSSVAQARESSGRIFAALLATVASISLLVGGIGIMNILLVSVTQRTREIGLRMAIGARRMHVLMQFLVESVLLAGIGGFAGVVAGVAISWLVAWLAGWPIALSPAAIVGGFLFSAAVGVFFGLYPARRAALLDPVAALRYE